MKESELKKLWQTTNEKLEESFAINRKNAEDISRLKVHHLLRSMGPVKIIVTLTGFIWVAAVVTLLNNLSFTGANKILFFSALIQGLLTLIALVLYLYQLVTIYGVEMSEPILQTQNSLSKLTISTLWCARILFLQLPLWTVFWWNETMLADWNVLQWTLTAVITVLFTYVGLWLFFNLKYKNRNKKWFKLILHGKEWVPLMKAMEMLEQVEEYDGSNQS